MIGTDQLPEGDATPLKTRNVSLPSRDQITSVQVHTLLQAVQTLNTLLGYDDSGPRGDARDGGVISAVETTIIKACAQLDNIFDDGSRWRMAHQNLLEKQLSNVYKAHLDLMKSQQVAIALTSAPHRHAGPKLLPLDDGRWAAVLGDGRVWEQCIVGVGDNPAAALADFDAVFNGLVKQHKSNEQSKNVDGGGSGGTEEIPGSGRDLRGDRPGTGPDGGELPPEV